MGVVYVVAVRTAWGQYIDQRAYRTLLGTGETADLPHVVGLGSITDYRLWTVAAALVIGLGLLAGRRWSLPVLLALPIAGILASQFLRDEVFLRPDFVGDGWLVNTFPSGHAAAAAGCVAAIVRAAPRRLAPVLAVLGAGWLTLVGQDLMVWGWHRPSDLIGSILVAAAVVHLVPATRGSGADHGSRTAMWTAPAAAVVPVLWAVGTGHLAVLPVGLIAAAAVASLVADGGAVERGRVRGVAVGSHHQRIESPHLAGAQQYDHRRTAAGLN
jgi:membrane-associated phospholipid phosphatase